jgi:hypothetical protein
MKLYIFKSAKALFKRLLDNALTLIIKSEYRLLSLVWLNN